VTDKSDLAFSPVDTALLRQFFEQSVSSDNFHGLGFLMSYLEKFRVDISEWNLSVFKRALDFHLNERFHLNSVLIVSKFYTYFHGCRLQKEVARLEGPLSQLSESEKHEVNARVFNQGALVDMRALFGFLVGHLGQRQALDPHTKDDALWNIVDFFTKAGVAEISAYGNTSYNTIAEKDIA